MNEVSIIINGITYVDLEYAKEIYNLKGLDLTKGICRINATDRRYKHLHGKLFIAESKLKGLLKNGQADKQENR